MMEELLNGKDFNRWLVFLVAYHAHLHTLHPDHDFAVTNARLQNLLCSRLEGPEPLTLLKDKATNKLKDNGNIDFLILGAPQWLRVHGEPAGHAANLCSNLRQCCWLRPWCWLRQCCWLRPWCWLRGRR